MQIGKVNGKTKMQAAGTGTSCTVGHGARRHSKAAAGCSSLTGAGAHEAACAMGTSAAWSQAQTYRFFLCMWHMRA